MEFRHFESDALANYDEAVSFREQLEKYLKHWKWFLLSIIVFAFLAIIKIRYSQSSYKINATILIKEQENGNSLSPSLSSFENLGLFGVNGDESLENEIQILKSRTLIKEVVQDLELCTTIYLQNSPVDQELYPNLPFKVIIRNDTNNLSNSVQNTKFKVQIRSKDKFDFIDFSNQVQQNLEFSKFFMANLGNEEESLSRRAKIELYEGVDVHNFIGETIIVNINSIDGITNDYLERINIEPINEKLSKVLNLSITESSINKGKAILNNLIEQYNVDGNVDKNLVSQATIDFLDERLVLISEEIKAIEGTAEQFKSKNRMVDVGSGADIFLQSSSANESELVNTNTQLQLANYMFGQLKNTPLGEPLPSNIGLSDPSVVNLIVEYNNHVLRRKRIMKSSSERNPIVVSIDSQLSIIKNNLDANLNTLVSSLQIQINALTKQSGRISSKIAAVPKNEREYKDIVRQQELKNSLYLVLLQKREESILSNAVDVNKARVIDEAYTNGVPESPKKILILFGFSLLGLLIPFLVIYLNDVLDTKVHSERDLAKLRMPYLGDIPLTVNKKDLYISKVDNSNIAEAFRYVRTNISFMLDRKDNCKVVFISSTQSKEGKTFAAINLASSLAISGKKTLLLGMDLRAPKINVYLDNLEDKKGVSNYITNDDLFLEDIILSETGIDNLHLINSGDIPPNPVELLMSRRVDELFEQLENLYDYIIVDTAPVGMVTDTIQIGKFADLTIYVVKANYLDKRMLHIPEKLNKENKLPNMAFLLNGTDHSRGAYGYGYGYGSDSIKKPWYKRIFKSAAIF